MQPATSAEGAHQHHPLQAHRLAGLDLVAHADRINLQGAGQVHRWPRAGGDHQGIAAPQGALQSFGGTEIEASHFEPPLLLRFGQGRWQHRARSQDRPHRQAAMQGLIHHPPTGFAGGTCHSHQGHRHSIHVQPCWYPAARTAARVWLTVAAGT